MQAIDPPRKDSAVNQHTTAELLTDLLTVCKEGEHGFIAGAEMLNADELSMLFMLRAGGCQRAAAELQPLIIQYGGKLPRHTDLAKKSIARWNQLRFGLSGLGDEAVLCALEREEQDAIVRYRSVLEIDDLPSPVRQCVEKQYQALRRSHQQITPLRERVRATTY
jgi:uncharacterized protein (TIGR02284 family)